MDIREKTDLVKQMVADAQSVWPQNFGDIENTFNQCSLSICVNIMKQFGIFQKKGQSLDWLDIKKKAGLVKEGEYIIKHILFILCEEGILEKKDDTYICLKVVDMENPAEILVKVTRHFPGEGAAFQWLARAYEGTADVVQGKIPAEDIMFPWGSFELVEDVYFSSKVYGYYSLLAGLVVKRLCDDLYGNKVCLLEVGAGTGNGTACVLEHSSQSFSRYINSDISRSLLKKSKKRFKEYDFMEYKMLDINKDLAEQGMEKESMDIILAVNVVHALDNTVESLKNLYPLLKKNGCLILAEIAPPKNSIYRYMELTFGLLASYYHRDDTDLRPVSAIIRPDKWQEIMKMAGLINTIAVPGNRADGIDRGGVVIGFK